MKLIFGVHAIVFSKRPTVLRRFFKDVLGWRAVDAGGGWPIYALPPAELAVHPARGPSAELYLMCDDVASTVRRLRRRGVTFKGGITDQGWGLLAIAKLPDGSLLGIYQPRHPSPLRKGKRLVRKSHAGKNRTVAVR